MCVASLYDLGLEFVSKQFQTFDINDFKGNEC